jgi:hypothetical protein
MTILPSSATFEGGHSRFMTPAHLSPNRAVVAATEINFEISIPKSQLCQDENSSGMEASTATAIPDSVAVAESSTAQQRLPASASKSRDDMSLCPICDGPQAYCHRHITPLSSLPTPLPIPPCTTQPWHMATFSLNCEQAEAMVARLAKSLDKGGQDTPAVQRGELPTYPEAARGIKPHLAAQGVEVLDIHVRRHQGRRPPQPIALQPP